MFTWKVNLLTKRISCCSCLYSPAHVCTTEISGSSHYTISLHEECAWAELALLTSCCLPATTDSVLGAGRWHQSLILAQKCKICNFPLWQWAPHLYSLTSTPVLADHWHLTDLAVAHRCNHGATKSSEVLNLFFFSGCLLWPYSSQPASWGSSLCCSCPNRRTACGKAVGKASTEAGVLRWCALNTKHFHFCQLLHDEAFLFLFLLPWAPRFHCRKGFQHKVTPLN